MPVSAAVKWNSMWKLKIMEKVKIFIWRISVNALPTVENLKKRGIHVDEKCIWCEYENPGSKHVFYDCHFARQVWALSFLTSKTCMREYESVSDWVIRVVSDLQNDDAEQFTILLWCLWHARNKKIFENEIINPMSVVHFGGKYLEEFRKANLNILEDNLVNRDVSVWRPPEEGTIKINFDAACSVGKSKGGVGMIARDWSANFIAAKSVAVDVSWQSDDMEALALRKTVDWIVESRFEKVLIEGDSANVLSLLNNPVENRSAMALMVESARKKLDEACSWKAEWIRRSANEAAHLLAKFSLDMNHNVCCFDVPPEWISSAIVFDSS